MPLTDAASTKYPPRSPSRIYARHQDREPEPPLPARPGTASTIASFTSAANNTPDDGSRVGRSSVDRASVRSSYDSPGVGRKRSNSSRLGQSFEALLASNETWILRESSMSTDPDSVDSQMNGQTQDGAPVRRATYSRSRRGTQGSGSVDATESEGTYHAHRSEVSLVGSRKASFSSEALHGQTSDGGYSYQQHLQQTSASREPGPFRTFRAMERTPSTSSTADSHLYATPPSGGASPASAIVGLPDDGPVPVTPTPGRVGKRSGPMIPSEPLPVSKTALPDISSAGGKLNGSDNISLNATSTTDQSRAKATHPLGSKTSLPFPPSEAERGPLSLDQEVVLRSPNSNTGGGTFKERMKKTSGFLKKLGASRERSKSSTANHPPVVRSRRPSSSSVTSDGAPSLAPSTRSNAMSIASTVTAGADNRSGFTGLQDTAPVPAIPSKYANTLRIGRKKNKGKEGEKVDAADAVGSGTLRSPLTPKKSSQDLTSRTITPRSLAQTNGDAMTGHTRKVMAAQGGSDSSGGEMRKAVRAWESEMEDALKESAKDLDKKTEFTPRSAWGTSPKLPDLPGLDHARARSGSFMEEDVDDAVTSPTAPSPTATAPGTSPAVTGKKFDKLLVLPTGGSFHSASAPNSPTAYSHTMRTSATHSDPATGSLSPSATSYDQTQRFRSSSFSTEQMPKSPPKQQSSVPGGFPSAAQYEQFASPKDSMDKSVKAGMPGSPNFSDTHSIGGSFAKRQMRSHETDHSASTGTFESAMEGDRRSSLISSNLEHPLRRSETLTSRTSIGASSSVTSAQNGHGVDEADEVLDPEKSIRLVTRPVRSEASQTEEANTADSCLPTPAISLATITEGAHSRDTSQASVMATFKFLKQEPTTMNLPMPPARTSSERRGSAHSVPARTSSPASVDAQNRLVSSSTEVNVLEMDSATHATAVDNARRCFEGDETFMKREKFAEWLGGVGAVNKAARQAYFEFFDFKDMRIDAALRKLCDKLFLRAETQQVDRILSAFSNRYWTCNQDSFFGSADVVHGVVFSLLLLNTDLHVADIQDRMTRPQFIRNTMSAIHEQQRNSGEVTPVASNLEAARSSLSVNSPGEAEPASPGGFSGQTGTLGRAKLSRAGSMRSHRSVTRDISGVTLAEPRTLLSVEDGNSPTPSGASTPGQGLASKAPSSYVAPSLRDKTRNMSSTSSLDLPGRVQTKAWDVELETLLKDMYNAVKAEQIRLPNAPAGLSPAMITTRRAPTANSDRVSALKRGSIRGLQGLLGSNVSLMSDGATSPGASSGSRSFADSWGQTGSSATSAHTLNAPTLGFANTLSQSIIKEAHDEETAGSIRSEGDEDLSDDELALIGAPWAKEGMLMRKHYFEAPQKRARDKNWVQTFVVVSKGLLSTFKFGDLSSSGGGGGPVGGGNWLSNATPLGEVQLAHSLANALPPPGYNRNRPHVFALTLPGGNVYFFQAGHEDLVHEWVSTCNYWAARQSREPLAGGVSNMEYGWSAVEPQPDDNEYGDDGDHERARTESADAINPEFTVSNSAGEASTSEGRSRLASTDEAFSTIPAYPGILNSSKPSNKASDARSIRSVRSTSARSMRVRGALYQAWPDASKMKSGSASILSSSPRPSLMLGSRNNAAQQHTFERTFINEWKPPAPPTLPSTLREDEQLERCKKQVERIEKELSDHTALRQPMLGLYLPHSQNGAIALANWERKSNYLLQDLVKYQCYVESLKTAQRIRAEKRDRREVDTMMARADEEMSRVRQDEEGGPVMA